MTSFNGKEDTPMETCERLRSLDPSTRDTKKIKKGAKPTKRLRPCSHYRAQIKKQLLLHRHLHLLLQMLLLLLQKVAINLICAMLLRISLVSFIGGGGSGKTSMGMIFQNDPLAVDARVESTIGFEVSTCEIHANATVADTASVSGGKGGFRRASQADGSSQSAKAVARSIT